MITRRFVMVLLVGLGALLATENASAAYQLRFEEAGCPTGPLTITDNDSNDSDSTVGKIQYVGSYCDFVLNVTLGLSKPLSPNSPTQAFMDLNTNTVASAAGGTLILTLVDTNFDFPGGSLTLSSSVGGTIGQGSVHILNGANPNNLSPLATNPTTIPAGSTVVDLGTFGPPAYNKTISGVNFNPAGQPYSLFLQATIALNANQQVAFDNSLQVLGSPVLHPATTLITQTVNPGTTVHPGTPVTITVRETNTGDSPITNVFVTGTGCSPWLPNNVAGLAVGAFQDFTCTFNPATSTVWSATGHGTDANGNAVPLTNETTGGTVSVINPATTLTTSSVSPSTTVSPGTSVTITVRETNTGDSTITGVSVTGTNSCPTWTGGSSTLAAGASTNFSCTFTVNSTVNWSATGHGTDILGNPVPLTGETTSGTITVGVPPLGPGRTATIGFWQNNNGQALIRKLNGGSTSTALANWLASNFPKLYGASSPNNLTGKTNADVAALFTSFFSVSGPRTNAQILAVALATYATNSTLAGGAYAASYGFIVNNVGTGGLSYNVGSNGTAIGLQNNTSYTILQLLNAANNASPFSPAAFTALNVIFSGINQSGDIL